MNLAGRLHSRVEPRHSVRVAPVRRDAGRRAHGAYPDPSKKDPKLLVVDIEAVKPLPRPVTLAEVKANSKLAKFDLVRLPRLSIMQVNDEQWKLIEEMANK